MATIGEIIRKKLDEHMLSPDQIEAILSDKTLESMAGRWDEDESKYPPALLFLLWLSVCGATDKWMEANCPDHFMRPQFQMTEDIR
jgi:hypothetical protein